MSQIVPPTRFLFHQFVSVLLMGSLRQAIFGLLSLVGKQWPHRIGDIAGQVELVKENGGENAPMEEEDTAASRLNLEDGR